jgi:hypothetical protein
MSDTWQFLEFLEQRFVVDADTIDVPSRAACEPDRRGAWWRPRSCN